MASQTQDVLYAVTGQSLAFDAPEGRPSSVTSSTVYENSTGETGTAESATTGSAAVETSPNTTFDQASAAGTRTCYLTATTGVTVGRVYLATNATGEKEWIEVTAVTTNDSATAREPLANDFTTADTFVGTRIAHAIDSTWVAASENISGDFDPNPKYRWRLVYVVASVTYVHDVYFDLVRYAARHDVTPQDVDRKFPGWLDRIPTYYREEQGRSLIDEAFREIKFDLYQELKPDQGVRNREIVNELVKLRAGYIAEPNELNAKRYQDRFAQLMHWTKVPMSTDSTGAGHPVDPTPIWSK